MKFAAPSRYYFLNGRVSITSYTAVVRQFFRKTFHPILLKKNEQIFDNETLYFNFTICINKQPLYVNFGYKNETENKPSKSDGRQNTTFSFINHCKLCLVAYQCLFNSSPSLSFCVKLFFAFQCSIFAGYGNKGRNFKGDRFFGH